MWRQSKRSGRSGAAAGRSRSRRAAARSRSPWVVKGTMGLLPWMIMMAAVIGALQGLRLFLQEGVICRLRQVRLLEEREGRFHPVTDAGLLRDVGQAAAVDREPQLARVDLRRVKSRVSAEHPELEQMVVRRNWPDRLTVLYRKRVPVAQIDAGRYFWVDGHGVLLPTTLSEADPAFPVIAGAVPEVTTAKPGRRLESVMLTRSLGVLTEFPRLRALRAFRVVRINAQDERNFSFVLDNGVEVRLGQASLQSKAKALGAVLASLPKDPEALPKYIDLRFEQVIVGPR